MENKSIQSQLFDYKDWDQADTMCFQFYDVILKIDIAEFKVGTKFHCVYIDFSKSKLVLMLPDGNYKQFQLNVSVGSELIK
ncbi:hypothetical protein NIES2100_04970 [Calothrix sp. NIES-2100]|uniref:hypothetical protein n=1 Tax=Calothrix sp. NIES-2100 TaxID=1954172 RepID=UPI000B5DC76E|nr:hypothetical protein NIES2100_04970 [Calothrix sp. NIES-2100]